MQAYLERDWPGAIAQRIADEWSGKADFPEDACLLESVLRELLAMHPDACRRLIGTGVIEEDYVKPVD